MRIRTKCAFPILAAWVLVYCSGFAPLASSQAPLDEELHRRRREAMVSEQIEARGIKDAGVIRAMRSVPRHLFVPPDLVGEAHADAPLPIGYGQTISQPYMVAYMSELLEVGKTDRVLEIGTGSGYQAAVLSKLAGRIYSIEIVPALARQARERLRRLGCDNVEIKTGDGYLGWPEKAPFDRILVTAAPPRIPQALIDQLAPGGRLVAPEGERWYVQRIVTVTKDSNGRVRRQEGLPVRFVPMVRAKPESAITR